MEARAKARAEREARSEKGHAAQVRGEVLCLHSGATQFVGLVLTVSGSNLMLRRLSQ
jgi:hypothetical protein